MVQQFRPNFPHRLKADGSYESICTLCHLTVATAGTEAALLHQELNHTCNPIRLYQLNEYPLWPIAQSRKGPRSFSAGVGMP
jgi:hypothetical protein